jgi:hypothetical protein
VNVSNTTDQYTTSGNATVVHNGSAGSATTGAATSNETSKFNISVTD